MTTLQKTHLNTIATDVVKSETEDTFHIPFRSGLPILNSRSKKFGGRNQCGHGIRGQRKAESLVGLSELRFAQLPAIYQNLPCRFMPCHVLSFERTTS